MAGKVIRVAPPAMALAIPPRKPHPSRRIKTDADILKFLFKSRQTLAPGKIPPG
jgi:hypothetical protein